MAVILIMVQLLGFTTFLETGYAQQDYSVSYSPCSEGARKTDGSLKMNLQFFAKKDLKQVTDAANQVGVDRTIFGEFIHEIKADLGMKASENFTYKELLDYANELKNMLGK